MISTVWECILGLFLGTCLLLLAWWYSKPQRRIGNYIECYGNIKSVKDMVVTVEYELDGKSYSSDVDEKLRSEVDVMPSAGLDVTVMVSPDAPEKPVHICYIRETGKVSRGSRKYLNNSRKSNVIKLVVCGLLLLFFGAYRLLECVGVI